MLAWGRVWGVGEHLGCPLALGSFFSITILYTLPVRALGSPVSISGRVAWELKR